MRTGWTISIALHVAAGVALLVAIPPRDRERDLVLVADVTLESMPEMTQPAAPQEQAPEIADFVLPDIAAPTVETDAGDPPSEDAAPVATVQDFVEDPSDRDAEADMSAVRTRVAEPDVQTEADAPEETAAEPPMPTLALPGTGIDDRTESPKGPRLAAPAAPRSAPSAFKPPAPPSRAKPAPQETPPTEETPDATEVAEQQEQTAPEESSDVPAVGEKAGAEEGLALKQARPPRPRPKDFQQRLAAAEKDRREAEARAREEQEARDIAAAVAAATQAETPPAETPPAEQRAPETPKQDSPSETSVERAAAEVPQGPPMTQAEIDGLKLQIGKCWKVPEGLVDSDDLRVVLSVELDPTGRVVAGPTLIEPAGAPSGAVRAAFETARRAILRCQGAGFELPREKYGQWRDLELVFDPTGVLARW